MSGDTYIRSILQKYDVNISGAEAAGNTIYPVIQRWGDSYLVKAEFSGSLEKGTGINIGTDADIFISVSSNTPGTLADFMGRYLTLLPKPAIQQENRMYRLAPNTREGLINARFFQNCFQTRKKAI